MAIVEGLEAFRNSLFQEALAILLKPGVLGEEHTRTIMDTIRELTMEARVRTLRAGSN